MRKMYYLLVMILITNSSFAQFPGAMAGAAKSPGAMNIGHVYGKLVDSTGKSISDASVVVLHKKYDSVSKKMKEVLFKSMNASANGEFSFEELPIMGSLKLKISAVGYKPIEKAVSFQMNMGAMPKASSAASNANPMAAMSGMLNAVDKDLGNIKLTEDAVTLQGVTVVSSAPLLKMDIDKKTYNVTKDIVSAGGTALDAMRNVPSVQVDIDGNVKLRNATPQLYIDGRPTTLSLDQIPADAIQSVEVITNPSAKYDASGGNAGILNIVLKKNRKSGYNGNLMAGVNSRGGFNTGGNFNVRQGKFNFSSALMVNAMKNKAEGTTSRTTYGNDTTHVYQKNNDNTNGAFIFGKIGLDYYITNRTTISLSGIRVHGSFKPNSMIKSDSLDNAGNVLNYNERSTTGERNFNAYGVQFGVVHNFAKEGEQLTFDGNVFSGKNNSLSQYTTNYFTNKDILTGTMLQKQVADGTNQFTTFQTDFVNPITKKTKLEAGLRMQLRKLSNNNETYLQSPSGDWVKNSAATNNYSNTDNVYAAYTTITSSIKDFGYQIGLRAEASSYNGIMSNTGEKFSNNYPISLFPSVFLSQKLKKNQELQLNFSRRINRPNFFQIIPFTDSTDLSNITRGNPNLVPEFTNSFEFSYNKNFKAGNSLLISLYYKHTNNLITRFLDSSYSPSGKLYLINSYINASSSYNYGAEITSVNKLTKWWDVTTNINIYKSQINVSNVPGATQQDAMVSWFGKLNNTLKVAPKLSLQISGVYQSKTNLPVSQGGGMMGPPGMQAQSSSQGYIKPNWGVDIAIKKTFMKNDAASVSLSISDIFRTRATTQISTSPFFYQEYYRLNNPQMVSLNFSYRFGKLDVSLLKRQNFKSSGTQDAMQISQ
jgi:ferric enterobactin receptor